MLEINPNCGLYYPTNDPGSADLCLAHDPRGHVGFTRLVVDAALVRQRRRAAGWDVRPLPGGGYGVFASRDHGPGDTLIPLEGKAHHLVSRSRMTAATNGQVRSRPPSHGWPLTDEVWVVWSPDPEEWRPVNHSCEPTAWLEGLDVVARVALSAGDEITLDYATFAHTDMPAFECRCGASNCRGVIRGSDHLSDVVDRYGDHISDYVKRKRATRGT
jgi:D-alanine-D-alanine ligase